MPAKISQQDVLRAPVSPTASSVQEAQALFQPPPVVAAPGLWKKIKKGVKNLFKKKGSDESTVEEESVEEESGGSVLEAVSSESSASAPPTPESGEDVGSGSGDEESLDQDEEYNKLSPEEKLAHLYETLGATDAFLQAISADAALRDAAVAQGSDTFVGFMAKDTLTDGGVQTATTAFSAKMADIISGLSDGSSMSEDTKTGLRRMLPAFTTAQAMSAFGKRFEHDMVESGGSWTIEHISQVWDQLAVLPPQDINGLTVLTTFNAIAGGGGYGPSWEAPNHVNTIQLGEDNSDPTYIAHTVRHEIGHAVHAEIPGQINPWLQGEIQFWFYNNDSTGVRQLITELGGFPAKYSDPDSGEEKDWTPDASTAVIDMLSSFIGGGSSWDPARATVVEGQTDLHTAFWQAMPESVQDVATQSPSHWYANYNNFARGTKGSYFLNYWYSRPFYMSDNAKSVVDATGDDYTAMSEKEFFANAYAEYFADPAGYNDESKWGGNLSSGVKSFFKNVIVDRQPYQAPPSPTPDEGGAGGDSSKSDPPGPTGMAGTP